MAPPLSLSSARIIDPILTTVAQGYSSMEYVGHKLFPRVPVSVRGGKILEFGTEGFQRYATRRAPGTRTARIEFGYSGRPFALVQDSLESPVPREMAQDAAAVPGLDLGRGAVAKVMRSLTLTLECDQADLATNINGYGANSVTLSGGAKWSASTGNPLTDIDAGREAIRRKCGLYPNICLMSAQAFLAAKNNPNIIGRFQYNGSVNVDASSITPKMLAGLFNVDEVIVAGAVEFSAAGGTTDIWGNNCVLAYVPQRPTGTLDLSEPSYGYTYTLGGNPLVEVPYWEQQSKSWIYGVTYERAPVLSGIASGYLIKSPA